MQRAWKFIYAGWGILCLVSGYRSLAPEHTRDFLMPWQFLVIAFFFFCITPLAVIALRNLFGIETFFRRPSLDRTVFDRRDILQAYRVFWISAALMSFGAGLALSGANHHGVMMFWNSVAMSAGLFVGERIVYFVHAKKIT